MSRVRNPMVWVFPEYGGQVAVRYDQWKLVRRDLKRKNAEPGAWELYDMEADRTEQNDLADQHPERLEKMLGSIVGFHIEMDEVVGKAKLSQNRNAADRAGVIAGLEAAGNTELASMMRRQED